MSDLKVSPDWASILQSDSSSKRETSPERMRSNDSSAEGANGSGSGSVKAAARRSMQGQGMNPDQLQQLFGCPAPPSTGRRHRRNLLADADPGPGAKGISSDVGHSSQHLAAAFAGDLSSVLGGQGPTGKGHKHPGVSAPSLNDLLVWSGSKSLVGSTGGAHAGAASSHARRAVQEGGSVSARTSAAAGKAAAAAAGAGHGSSLARYAIEAHLLGCLPDSAMAAAQRDWPMLLQSWLLQSAAGAAVPAAGVSREAVGSAEVAEAVPSTTQQVSKEQPEDACSLPVVHGAGGTHLVRVYVCTQVRGHTHRFCACGA